MEERCGVNVPIPTCENPGKEIARIIININILFIIFILISDYQYIEEFGPHQAWNQ